MTFLEILILGIVQGIMEFLPISSDGHLCVANALINSWGGDPVKDFVEVEIILHLGTLLAVLVFYRHEIAKMFSSERRVILLVLLGTIPAAIIGIYLKKGLPTALSDAILQSPLLAGLGFPVTAAFLWWTTRLPEGDGFYPQLSWKNSLIIGAMQSLALLPGVSRSGSTIAAGLGVGLQRESAATFSFLLAIPAIAGGGLLEMIDVLQDGATGTPIGILAAGFLISFVVGLAALASLMRFVRKGKLMLFVYYLVPLGIAVTAWQLGLRYL